jgi:DNA-binding transcriptional LysR family regulator
MDPHRSRGRRVSQVRVLPVGAAARIDIRHLRHFVAVAEELHFRRAAERLHMSQPPLSQSIRALETALGASLLDRTSRQVSLTEVGRVFLDHVRPVIALFDESVDAALRAARGEAGTLTVGYAVSAGFEIVPRVLHDFHVRYPGVHVQLRGMSATEQIEGIRKGTVHVGFIREPDNHSDLVRIPILKERLLLAYHESSPLAERSSITLRDVEHLPFVMSERGRSPGMYDKIVHACRRAGFSPQVVQEASEVQTVLGLVAAGVGVTLVPDQFRQLALPGLRFAALPDVTTQLTLAIVHDVANRSSLVEAFVEVAIAALESASTPASRLA